MQGFPYSNRLTRPQRAVLHAGLLAGETIVELYVERAELQCAAGAHFATFCELDFFQHATQTTPVVQGPR